MIDDIFKQMLLVFGFYKLDISQNEINIYSF